MKDKVIRRIETTIACLVFLLIIWLALLSIGCGALLPEKRTEGASVKASESVANTQTMAVERITRGTPPPSVTVSGVSNRVELNYGSTGRLTSAARVEKIPPSISSETDSQTFTESVKANVGTSTDSKVVDQAKAHTAINTPLFVSLIGCAVGILLLLYTFKQVKNSSTAISATFDLADETLKRHIENARSRAISSVDKNQIAEEMRRIAEYEAERGKLALHRPPPKR